MEFDTRGGTSRSRMESRVLLVLAVLIILAAVPAQSAFAADQPKEIRIGGTLSFSGPYQAIVGPFGKLANAWADRVNARGGIFLRQYNKALPVRFILSDDRSEPPTALSLYERLATVDKVDLFIGPFSSGLNNAAVQAALTNKIPFFVPEGNDIVIYETPNPWRATAFALAEAEYQRLAELYARIKGVKTFAILARDNLHEIGAAKGFAALLTRYGFQVVYQDVAPKDTKDFASIILKMKQANPDVVVVESLPPPWTIGFLKQARELGLAPRDLVSAHTPVPVIKALDSGAEGIVSLLWSFEGDTPDHQEFMAICHAAGIQPWEYSEAGVRYVTYRWIEETLKRAGTLDRDALREAMVNADFTLFGTEHVTINEQGYGTLIPYPTQIKRGRHMSLWPLDKGAPTHAFREG